MRLRPLPLLLFAAILLCAAMLPAMTPEAKRSFDLFERRVEAGEPEAMFRMSALLERGFDTIPADTLRSISLLRRSAEAGFPAAANYLGYLYQMGRILPENRDSAIYWLRVAADAGDPKAAHNIAWLMLERSESADTAALPYLERAADAGIPASITMLADLYGEGRILPKDTAKAVALYEKAIGLGWGDAQLRLLNMMGPRWSLMNSADLLSTAIHYRDLGANTIASELLLHIAPGERETPAAYALLGDAYSRGRGVAYDHDRSIEYFYRAAEMGHPSAQFILAETLEIFPDALAKFDPDRRMTPQSLRESAAAKGVTTAEEAAAALDKTQYCPTNP